MNLPTILALIFNRCQIDLVIHKYSSKKFLFAVSLTSVIKKFR